MSPRNWQFRLEDISGALILIAKYTEGLSYDQWKEDQKTIDAVIRNFEIIGEAATYFPEEIQEQYPDVPWYQMRAMRNILIHEYFGVDIDILWKTIHEELPPLKLKIDSMLRQYKT